MDPGVLSGLRFQGQDFPCKWVEMKEHVGREPCGLCGSDFTLCSGTLDSRLDQCCLLLCYLRWRVHFRLIARGLSVSVAFFFFVPTVGL